MNDKTKGAIALLITAMVWGSGFIAQKLGNNYMPPLSFNAVRMLMGTIVLLPVLALNLRKNGYFSPEKNTAEELGQKRRKMLKGGLICGIMMLLGNSLQQVGLLTVSAGKSGFITATYIVFVLVFNVFFRQKVTLRAVLCTALALLGFAVMSLSGDLSKTTSGDWLTLLSAMMFAFQIHFVNMFLDDDNDIILSVLQMGFAGMIGFAVAFMVEHPQLSQLKECMPVLLYATFIPTAIGYTFQIIGQKNTPPSLASMIMSLESVFAALFGALFLKEMMSVREIAGCVIILTATILGQRGPDPESAVTSESGGEDSGL